MTIAESLKRFRKSAGLSQKELSAAIGIPYQSYQTYEYGSSIPSAKVIVKIAQAFNVSADYLLGLSEEPRTIPPNEFLVASIKKWREAMQEVLEKVAE